jgi:hypothetical protein
MSFQAYLDTIKEKTGKSGAEFVELAREKGFLERELKAGEIVEWLKNDFDLGRGHAMAIVVLLKNAVQPRLSTDQLVDKLISGTKTHWRNAYDDLLTTLKTFGADVNIATTDSYISLLRRKKKFAVMYFTAERMDIGIKRKGVPATERFALAGSWNNMVTHRVRIATPSEIDTEVITWLREAYDAA